MGLIQAFKGALGGQLADQWKEFFYCDAIPADVLVVKGQKKVTGRSSNTKGEDNIISNGSRIAVNNGQCMIIVESGKVVELCAEPGEFTYDSGTEHSFFDGGKLGENFIAFFKQFGDRFTFGGQPGKDQRVYYFNIKEIIGNKYGTPRPVPFRVVDQRAGIDIDVSVKCFGEYSYKISNPMVFYTNICGNVATQYNRSEIDGQLKSEFLTALQPAFARISEMGIRYSAVMAHTQELADAMREELTKQWFEDRGIEIVKVGVSSLAADEEDEKMLKELQKNAAFVDPNIRNANLAGATMTAMNAAANNQQAGPAMAFMGMNMAQMAGANAAGGFAQADMVNAQINQQYQQQAPAQQAAPAPAAVPGWTCPACGKPATGKFCPECGAKRPEPEQGWKCSCGAVNTGKFCVECGAKKPAGEPIYKCDKCGWEPEDPKNPPKFCPQCGDPFDDNDVVS